MRDFKGMKRQRGRNRNGGGAGGKPQAHNANRAFDSNGPEGIKVRGNAQHVFEKYQQLARDAQTSGDRVLAENYLQHAEHYFRVIRAVTPTRSPADILGRDAVQSGYDIDFEDESGAQAYADAQAETEVQGQGQGQPQGQYNDAGDQQPRRDDRGQNNNGGGRDRDRDQNRYENRNREDRPREDRPRDDRPRDDQRSRDDRPREDRQRDDRPRDERPRDDRPREERAPRQDRFEGRRDRNRDDRGPREERIPNPAADPVAAPEPQAAPQPAEAQVDNAPVLRSGDGEVSRAPNFLSGGGPRKVATLTPEAGEEPAPKPKRRRAPKSFEGGDAAPAAAVAPAEEG